MPLKPLPTDYQNPLADANFGPLFEQYRITYGKALEFVQANLYDTITIGAGGQTNFSVFDGSRNVTTNRIICNMPGNTLPDRQGFLVMAIQTIMLPRPTPIVLSAVGTPQVGPIDDMVQFLFGGIFELRLYEKLYAQVPLIMTPAGCGIDARWDTGAPADVIQFANNGVPDARNLYTLEEPVFIPPLVQIQAQLSFLAGLVVTTPLPIKMNLGGLMVRPVQ